jgi:hypothetical protein
MKYRQTVLAELARHGVIPGAGTSPDLIHDYLNDLYRYEIRHLKSRLQAGLIQRSDYSNEVEKLRDRYPLLGLPLRLWTEDSSTNG